MYLHAASPAQGRALDDLLWQLRPASFIPHNLLTDTAPLTEPVSIAMTAPPSSFTDVLINLSGDACATYQQFNRVNEIITADPASIRAGRERYRFYRDAGAELKTHKL